MKVKQDVLADGVLRTDLPKWHLVPRIQRWRPWLAVLTSMFLAATPKAHTFQALQSLAFKAQPSCCLKINLCSQHITKLCRVSKE